MSGCLNLTLHQTSSLSAAAVNINYTRGIQKVRRPT